MSFSISVKKIVVDKFSKNVKFGKISESFSKLKED